MRRLPERPFALLLGALAGSAWQSLGWWPAIIVALAGFSWLVGRTAPAPVPRAASEPDPRARPGVAARPTTTAGLLRRAAALGWWFGLGQGIVALHWVYVIGWYVVPPLLCFMALWQALAGVGIAAAHRLTRNPVAGAALGACAWSLSEFGAGRVPFGGFGWLRLAYTQVDSLLAGWLPVIGVGGVSFVVALLAHLLAALPPLLRTRPRGWLLAPALAVALVAGAPLAGRLVPVEEPDPGTRSVHIGMVQGNVDGSAGPHAMGYARSVTDNHVSQTVTLMARARAGLDPTPDFVLWPENSTDVDPTKDAQTAGLVQRASRIAGLPILVGAVMEGPGVDERQTSALWWSTDGEVQARYDKRNLVPFGEWIPLRRQLLPILPVLSQVGAQSIPGSTPGTLHVVLPDGSPLVIGDVVCFELAWDSTVHDTVSHGAQVLVVQSNNGTYTGTAQPQQQFAITRARAMELRREIVVSTTNSLSGLVHPDGSVTGLTREGTADARTFTVPRRDGVTPAVRTGPAVELAASGLAALTICLAAARARRRPSLGAQ
ncbi:MULTISPECIES: apolipoprotein N-acyltransferase [unclassified Luteococcus]|uniref:apolipoprotein N-acyltransferase n=1 Tax=unclassified Luteococcus TaxID=2639923 RepID=UPI00313CCEC1